MNEIEKSAIETVRYLKCLKWYEHAFDNGTEVLEEEEKQDIDVVLNLVEKQINIIKNAINYIQHNNKELKNYSEQEMLDWLYGLDKCCEIKEEN